MTLPIAPPYAPMEARLVDGIPEGPGWQYEPKWDGFRCVAFRDGDDVRLQSKAGQPLERYFPDVVSALLALAPGRFVLDGELVIPVGTQLVFDELLLRIHPAASRVAKLAAEHPATYVVFDLLVDARGERLDGLPLDERRRRLEAFAAKTFEGNDLDRVPRGRVLLSPATGDLATARRWLRGAGGALDGVVAKRCDETYRSGERAMQKIKLLRTAECVVGGFRYGTNSRQVGSLLLGLYDDEGRLDHVGFTSGIPAAQKKAWTERLEKIVEPPGFTGSAPGGPSRWSRGKDTSWQPVRPEIVVEVQYDHFSGGRFRHGTKLLRLRPDKPPRQCALDQVKPGKGPSPMALLKRA